MRTADVLSRQLAAYNGSTDSFISENDMLTLKLFPALLLCHIP